MTNLVIVWLFVAFVMWAHYKISHHGKPYVINGPPQQTFLGALMWPFYLLQYIIDVIKGSK